MLCKTEACPEDIANLWLTEFRLSKSELCATCIQSSCELHSCRRAECETSVLISTGLYEGSADELL